MVYPDGDPFRHSPDHSTINVEDELSTGSERGTWFIPRPALCRNSVTCTCNSPSERQASNSIQTVSEWLSPQSSSSTPSSNSSTQSGSSGTLLLTAANLAALRLEQAEPQTKPCDTASIASSTHFTVVNGMSRKPLPTTVDCCLTCHKHQLTVVVLSVCSLFLIGLCLAVYYIDMRARATLS